MQRVEERIKCENTKFTRGAYKNIMVRSIALLLFDYSEFFFRSSQVMNMKVSIECFLYQQNKRSSFLF